MGRKSRRQIHLAITAQKCWSAEDHSLSNDNVYFMDISGNDELSLNDSNFERKVILSIRTL